MRVQVGRDQMLFIVITQVPTFGGRSEVMCKEWLTINWVNIM